MRGTLAGRAAQLAELQEKESVSLRAKEKRRKQKKKKEIYGIWHSEPKLCKLSSSDAQIVHGRGGSRALTASARPCRTCFMRELVWRVRSRACGYDRNLRQFAVPQIPIDDKDSSLTDSALSFSRSSSSRCEVIVAK